MFAAHSIVSRYRNGRNSAEKTHEVPDLILSCSVVYFFSQELVFENESEQPMEKNMKQIDLKITCNQWSVTNGTHQKIVIPGRRMRCGERTASAS